MHRPFQRAASAALALLMLAGSLAACSAPTTDPNNDSPVDVTTPADTTASPDTTSAPDTTAAPQPKETKPYAPVEVEMPEDESLLYNGIRLPEVWPPENPFSYDEANVPYLKDADEGGYHPDVVDIDVGRQLFVDDFLIDSTTLKHTAHKAVEYEGNPVMAIPGKDMRTKNGGFFYNAEKGIYELYFTRGNKLMYLSSPDGIAWDQEDAYPVLVFPDANGGYASVVRNETPDDLNPRYLCVVRYNNASWLKLTPDNENAETYHTIVYSSDNGQAWRKLSEEGPTCGDATTVIYNPFRKTWIFSLRRWYYKIGRARDYVECKDIFDITDYTALPRVDLWQRADKKDVRHQSQPNFTPELYSLSAIAYESIMLGAFQMYLGPDNSVASETGIPKITNLNLGYSRDGFYYARPDREAILESSRDTSTWDCGYLHPLNTVCVIVGEELRFYYTGYRGVKGMPGTDLENCSLGFATMRRDGFVSLDGSGEVITRLMRFDEVNDRLFINAKAKSIRAEIRDTDNKVIPGFSLDECNPFSGDSTCTELTFTSGKNLGELQGKDFSIRFVVEDGEFYAFWVSDTADGESGGFLAAGYDGR